MSRLVFLIACFMLFLNQNYAEAQSTSKATRIGKYNDWGTYQHQTKKDKTCYALTVPVEKQPKNLDHGDIFFFVTKRSGQEPYFESQFVTGYDLQAKSKVVVSINEQEFIMFTKDRSAWIEKRNAEPELINAMKSGSTMKIQAKSRRGNPTIYTFSLRGISAALDSLSECELGKNSYN